MSKSETIRDGLVAALAPLLSTNSGPLGQILPYPISSLNPPCAWVDGGEVEYDLAMGRGLDKQTFKVTVAYPFNEAESGQKQLDNLRDGTGALSVKTLLESDRTLGGAVQATHVTALSAIKLYDRASGPTLIGCEWTVDVYP